MGVMDGVKVVEVAEHGFVPSAAAILAEWGGRRGQGRTADG